jgi:hypothetical protein
MLLKLSLPPTSDIQKFFNFAIVLGYLISTFKVKKISCGQFAHNFILSVL